MKTFSPIQKALLHILQDGNCHSGNALGEQLNVSRTAIWKQINQLIDMGLPLKSHDKQGYQLIKPLILLDEDTLHKQLNDKGFPHEAGLHLFMSIDSTNSYLKALPANNRVEICCAEMQTQGRGRFGREWFSPLGENIYCSSRWRVNCDLSRLSGLSLVVSLAILETLKQFHRADSVKIKWPNDLIWNEKKLCGILIEIIAESNSNAMVIIGIGLNVNSDTLQHPLPDRSWCSLYEMTQSHHDRNQLISQLQVHLAHYVSKFIEQGFEAFKEQWQEHDYLENKAITVQQPAGSLKGIAKGVNQNGELILMDEKGFYHELSIGETSLSRSVKK